MQAGQSLDPGGSSAMEPREEGRRSVPGPAVVERTGLGKGGDWEPREEERLLNQCLPIVAGLVSGTGEEASAQTWQHQLCAGLGTRSLLNSEREAHVGEKDVCWLGWVRCATAAPPIPLLTEDLECSTFFCCLL